MAEFKIESTPYPMNNAQTGEIIKNNKVFKSGSGTSVFKVDKYGVFAGGDSFESAPWAVDYDGNQYVGDAGEIKFDGPNKQIIAGGGNDIVIDGVAGTITTDKIKDKTYGLYGVFCYTSTNTNTSSTYTHTTTIPDTGGLLNATLNYIDSNGYYKLLPGFNVSSGNPYYYVYKDAGFYKVKYYAGNIYADVSHTRLYITLFFNSIENNSW